VPSGQRCDGWLAATDLLCQPVYVVREGRQTDRLVKWIVGVRLLGVDVCQRTHRPRPPRRRRRHSQVSFVFT